MYAINTEFDDILKRLPQCLSLFTAQNEYLAAEKAFEKMYSRWEWVNYIASICFYLNKIAVNKMSLLRDFAFE